MSKPELPVTPQLCERILLTVLRELGIPSGGRVLRATLDTEWNKTGLRDTDLAQAIDGLIGKHQMRQYDFETLELCAAGHRRIHSARFSEIASSLAARRVLSRAAQRLEDEREAENEAEPELLIAERRKSPEID